MFLPTVSDADRQRAKDGHAGLTRLDFSVLVHPVRYLKWRRDVARNGPYASAYEGGRAPQLTPVVGLLLASAAMAAAIVIILVESH